MTRAERKRKKMAKIMKTSEQEQALDTIVNSLKSLKSVNGFLDGKDDMGDTVKLTVEAGKSKAVVDRFMSEEAVKILVDYRKATVSKVKTLSKKFAIALDAEDEEILEGGKKREVIEAVQAEAIEEDGEVG